MLTTHMHATEHPYMSAKWLRKRLLQYRCKGKREEISFMERTRASARLRLQGQGGQWQVERNVQSDQESKTRASARSSVPGAAGTGRQAQGGRERSAVRREEEAACAVRSDPGRRALSVPRRARGAFSAHRSRLRQPPSHYKGPVCGSRGPWQAPDCGRAPVRRVRAACPPPGHARGGGHGWRRAPASCPCGHSCR